MKEKTSLVLMGAGLLSALTLALPRDSQADGRYSRRSAARQEIRQNWREIRSDRAELRRDVQEYHRDIHALRQARRHGASPEEIARLRGEVRQGAREIAQDRRELREDYAELRRDLDRYGYYNRGHYRNRHWWGWSRWGWGSGRWERHDRWDGHWE
jgi:SMC interacting uncharacterized protein involved in chromosome segregation